MENQKKVILLMPYFGRWPDWIDYFLESCKFNPMIEWLFFTNCAPPSNRCDNVNYIEMSWDDCQELISKKLHIDFSGHHPYKLCDIRPAYGVVFADYILGYDYFGFGDIDVIYGDMGKFLTPDVFEYDCITFNDTRISGHLTLLRSVTHVLNAYMDIPDWKEKMQLQKMQFIDEKSGFYGIKNVYNRESYNTPMSSFIPWTDGTFCFPEEWYWRNGQLTNNLNLNYEFLYLHFMRIRNDWWARGLENVAPFKITDAQHGWKINANGFSKLLKEDIIPQAQLKAGFEADQH